MTKLQEAATKAAMESRESYHCPCCGETTLWTLAKRDFVAGAKWALKEALLIWGHENHVYCDFHYDGGLELAKLAEDEAAIKRYTNE